MEGWGVFHFIVKRGSTVSRDAIGYGCRRSVRHLGLFRMDEKKVSDIIDYCAELGLFNKELWQDKQILTSEEIQELYGGICKAIHRKPGIPKASFCWKRNRHRSPPPYRMPLEQQDTRHMNADLRFFRRMEGNPGRP